MPCVKERKQVQSNPPEGVRCNTHTKGEEVAEIAIGLFWAVVVYWSGEVLVVLWVDYDPSSVPSLTFPQLPKRIRRSRRRPNRATVVIMKAPRGRQTRRRKAACKARR